MEYFYLVMYIFVYNHFHYNYLIIYGVINMVFIDNLSLNMTTVILPRYDFKIQTKYLGTDKYLDIFMLHT